MKKYVIRESIPAEANDALKPYSEMLRKLLHSRGLDTAEKAEKFLNPNYETDIHDPFLLKDMDKAVERILKAIEKKEKIIIYSDYDADGIPAAVVMADFFKMVGHDNFEVYIPHRHNEGYGLHLEAIETFREKGVHLIITLDCGIVDHNEIKRAKELGIDIIVTDHHLPNSESFEAYAVVNPKRADCSYPYDMLCGAGVGFKLVQGLMNKYHPSLSATPPNLGGEASLRAGVVLKPGQEKWLLDMVGIATLSDMVPLNGENRVLAYYGLKVLHKTRRPGLLKLLRMMRIDPRNITEDDIGFMVTPRLNAASRMGIPMDAYELLATTDHNRGSELATHLDKINNERKGLVASMVKEIKKTLREREEYFAGRRVIVMGNPSWRPAILGLAANSIAEDLKKPVFLWGRDSGDGGSESKAGIKGSCRSGGSSNVVKIMEAAKESFEQFGGHAFSGGFSLSPEMVHTIEDVLENAIKSLPDNKDADQPDLIDTKLSLDEVSWNTYRDIEKLAPFGVGNTKPLFLFENIKPIELKMFGKAKEHLELSFVNVKGDKIKAIGFFTKPEDFASVPRIDFPLNLIATMEKSFFGRSPELRLRIEDII